MDETFLAFVAAAVIGLLAGWSIGFVSRGARARRATEKLQSEVKNLKAELAQVSHSSQTASTSVAKPQRWTGTEVAAVLGAIGTVLGVLGAIYGNFQDTTIKQQTATIKQLEEKLVIAEDGDKAFKDSSKQLFTYEPAIWSQLVEMAPAPPVKPKRSLDLDIDNRKVLASCDNQKQVSLNHNGFGPSVLVCSGKSVIVRLAKPTRLMLVAAEPKQP